MIFFFDNSDSCLTMIIEWELADKEDPLESRIKSLCEESPSILLPVELFDPCKRSSKVSMYSMALRKISTFGSRCSGLLHVRRFNFSNASLTCA